MRPHRRTPQTTEPHDKPSATPAQAMIGILEGAAATIAARRNDLNTASLSTAEIAAIARSVTNLDSQVTALKKLIR